MLIAMIYKIFLGYLAVGVGLAGYSFYLRSIFKGRTKPHAFSWLLWGILTGIVFVAQLVKGGGSGSWATGMSSVVCFSIGFIGLKKDTRGFSRFDWVFLGAAVVALLCWFFTKQPTFSIMLVTTVDVLGYASTLRKGYRYPHEENVASFSMQSLKYVVSITALQSYSLVTWLYPAAMIVMNSAVAILVAARQYQEPRSTMISSVASDAIS